MDLREALDVLMTHSVAGLLYDDKLSRRRPCRRLHHCASLPVLSGGGIRGRPGEIARALKGVLFIDELLKFANAPLKAIRQPIESTRAIVAHANAYFTYPACFQLIAAMNSRCCG